MPRIRWNTTFHQTAYGAIRGLYDSRGTAPGASGDRAQEESRAKAQ
jgi:hypothetical protein